jgi:hypothetical protein
VFDEKRKREREKHARNAMKNMPLSVDVLLCFTPPVSRDIFDMKHAITLN